MTIENIGVRFFTSCLIDDEFGMHEVDICEITEEQFLVLDGVISYERHSVFENGCRQICLTKECLDIPEIEEL